MKLKKFNVVLAASALSTAILLCGIGSYAISQFPWPNSLQVKQSQASTVPVGQSPEALGSKADFSSRGKQVLNIPWRSQHGQLPESVTLQKWVDGDKTYYRIRGPINPQYADIAAGERRLWGEFFGCEVYFERGGGSYDQWIINPNASMVYTFSHACKQDGWGSAFSGQSRLPASHYRATVVDNHVEITFWCDNRDTPANIVFNYNDPATDEMYWVTTGNHKSGEVWNHHWAGNWTCP